MALPNGAILIVDYNSWPSIIYPYLWNIAEHGLCNYVGFLF